MLYSLSFVCDRERKFFQFISLRHHTCKNMKISNIALLFKVFYIFLMFIGILSQVISVYGSWYFKKQTHIALINSDYFDYCFYMSIIVGFYTTLLLLTFSLYYLFALRNYVMSFFGLLILLMMLVMFTKGMIVFYH